MRASEKELIARYFNSQITATEEEVRILQQRVRFRRIDVNDSYELQNALRKLVAFSKHYNNIDYKYYYKKSDNAKKRNKDIFKNISKQHNKTPF